MSNTNEVSPQLVEQIRAAFAAAVEDFKHANPLVKPSEKNFQSAVSFFRANGLEETFFHKNAFTSALVALAAQGTLDVEEDPNTPEKVAERQRKRELADRRDGSLAGNKISLREEARKSIAAIHEGLADIVTGQAAQVAASLPTAPEPPRELPTPQQIADGETLSERQLNKLSKEDVKRYLQRSRRADEILRHRRIEANREADAAEESQS